MCNQRAKPGRGRTIDCASGVEVCIPGLKRDRQNQDTKHVEWLPRGAAKFAKDVAAAPATKPPRSLASYSAAVAEVAQRTATLDKEGEAEDLRGVRI